MRAINPPKKAIACNLIKMFIILDDSIKKGGKNRYGYLKRCPTFYVSCFLYDDWNVKTIPKAHACLILRQLGYLIEVEALLGAGRVARRGHTPDLALCRGREVSLCIYRGVARHQMHRLNRSSAEPSLPVH